MDNIIGGTNRKEPTNDLFRTIKTTTMKKMPKYIYVCRNTYEIIQDEKMAKDVKNCSAYIKGKCGVDDKKCKLIKYQKEKS